jgi:hypothetical protein
MAVTIEDVLAQLNPKLRKTVMAGDTIPATQYAQTPSFGLNRALNGGLPYGRQVLIWGSKSSAKVFFMPSDDWPSTERRKRYVHGLMLRCHTIKHGLKDSG